MESFIESEVPHLRLFLMLSIMPLKRWVATENVLTALLGQVLEIMGQICRVVLILLRTCPHGLESNNTLKCGSNNYSVMLTNILFFDYCETRN